MRRFIGVALWGVVVCTGGEGVWAAPRPAGGAQASRPAGGQSSSAPVEKKPATSRPAAKGIDWSAFLIHDAAIQAELKMTEPQRQATAKLMDEVSGELWKIRAMAPEEAGKRSAPLEERVEAANRETLTEAQRRRLVQLALQSYGPEALLAPTLGMELGITDEQRERLSGVTERAMAAMEQLGQLGLGRETQLAASRKIYSRRDRDAMAILTEEQRRAWFGLVGPAFDHSRVGPMRPPAPELATGGEWINSKPLTLAGLRGGVVVLHFWTFACGNCINNYPSYRTWQKAFAGKNVTMIGIHTPETKGERSVDAVRAKAKSNELLFPICIDNEKQNWNAWGNNVWPAVYLIDKKGRVRYWWYGELNWKGAKGEQYMTDRINELLAEKP